MIFAPLTGNFGNNLLAYVLTRCVAYKNGYEFGFNRHPTHDYFQGTPQLDFLNLDYGLEHNYTYFDTPDFITTVWNEPKEVHNGYTFYPYCPEVFDLPDNTKLVIACGQDERYYLPYKNEIRKWICPKDNSIPIELDDDTCVINVRGGYEYLHSPVLLPQKYWNDGMEYMRSINPRMKFICVTDDVSYAQSILPCPVYHFSIEHDYKIINQARYLLISNSSFAIFPTWLNENVKEVIAPKYWANFNRNGGYWASSDVRMSNWKYLTKDGDIHDS